jgi:hypothetical protein
MGLHHPAGKKNQNGDPADGRGKMSTSVFAAIYKHWIWLGVPFIIAGLAGVIFMIRGVIVLMRESQIARMPLAESLEISFPEAGKVVLNTESPRFSRLFAHAKFELRAISGELVPGRRVLFAMSSSKVSTVSSGHTTYEIPRRGRYVLRVEGIEGSLENNTRHFISFDRPHGIQTVGFILGMILSFFVFLASFLVFMWRVLGLKMQN